MTIEQDYADRILSAFGNQTTIDVKDLDINTDTYAKVFNDLLETGKIKVSGIRHVDTHNYPSCHYFVVKTITKLEWLT